MQAHYHARGMTDPLDDDALDAWRAFLTAHAHVTRRIGRDLAEAGLPDLGWYDLLWALRRQPERRLRVNELAREVVLSPTAMSRFVDRVEKEGYIRREPDPTDRRALQITITDAGIDLLKNMWPIYEAGIEEHFAAQLGRSPAAVRQMFVRMVDSATRPAGESGSDPRAVPARRAGP
jgi:DNA-binding MarR family transcriptional regulator